ncbi:PREDICTED: E3 ubiquitin-protein ligase SINA-like 7 [Camelina sativa]|uniref:RING-type E3 ubiquitin transferase n=1 Tax=Camelina sativa TaxID=90675 RepID=A0ABM0U4J6_CAMSA|nr:PREDICTED: E3 ubiquitin-protein ligase SINA-like 7 [Camelina sativa]
MMLMDLDILDCPICYEALTVPIFQCDNGHIACSSCCPKLKNKCPACALPIGHSRCRAMEKVVKSVSFPCPNSIFGCTESSSYGKESNHEKECNFSPCSCPEQDCNYTGPYKDLYNHYALTHSKGFRLDSFSCGVSFTSLINISGTMKIEKEDVKRLLFAVQCFREPCGVYLTVSCIAPSTPEVGEYSYHVSYNVDDGHTLTYGSPNMKRILEVSFHVPQQNFMFIPNHFLRGDWLDIELCIRKLN